MKISRANINVLTINLKFEKNLFTFTAQMMNLLIDIGNSSAKVAISENKKIIEDFRFAELDTNKILDIINEYKIQNSALSNV